MSTEIPLKKTTKKSKLSVNRGDLIVTPENNNIQCVIESDAIPETDSKKRGRKPKGGKFILKPVDATPDSVAIPNIILHLKCSSKDLDTFTSNRNKMVSNTLNYNPEIPPEIMTYNLNEQRSGFSMYNTNTEPSQPDNTNTNNSTTTNSIAKIEKRDLAYTEPISLKQKTQYLCSDCGANAEPLVPSDDDDVSVSVKEVSTKLKKLKINLYKNSMPEKKSACFWCTYEYDNQSCYIPKYELDGTIIGYGSFCRPECAVAFLMKESIDDSTKFERYHLLNQIYGRVNEFKKNIKPAPDPHFLLEKFYGNLTIQEYRKLLNTEHMLLVIDKPLTRILPELHEDTDDFIMGIYGGTKGNSSQAGGVYKVKRQSEKQEGPSKSSIMKGKFGLSQ